MQDKNSNSKGLNRWMIVSLNIRKEDPSIFSGYTC
jgi:hypothetical protein